MGISSIKKIRGIAKEYLKILERIAADDEALFRKLETFDGMSERLKTPRLLIRNIHTKVRADLNEAVRMCDEAEINLKRGGQSERVANQILPKLDSFYKYILGYAEPDVTTELRVFSKLIQATDETWSFNAARELLSKHYIKIMDLHKDEHFAGLHDLLFNDVVYRVKTYFKVKKGLFSMGRPDIREKMKFGDSEVFLKIYYGRRLSEDVIKTTIESIGNILISQIEKFVNQGNTQLNQRIKLRVENKLNNLSKLTLQEIEALLLAELKDVIVTIFKKNPELILLPKITYHLLLSDDAFEFTARSYPANSLDVYRIEFGIGMLIALYLVCDNMYDTTNASFLFSISQLLRGSRIYTPEDLAMQRINSAAGNSAKREINTSYRSFSVYGVLLHETEHSFDRRYLSKNKQATAFFKSILEKAESVNQYYFERRFMKLAEFYIDCRAEAPTQFRELIATYEAETGRRDVYASIAPVKSISMEIAVQKINAILKSRIKSSDFSVELEDSQFNMVNMHYMVAHIMNMTIFMADCLTAKVNLVLLDPAAMKGLMGKFPKVTAALFGMGSLPKIDEGSSEWFFLQSVKAGTTRQFIDLLDNNGIKQVPLKRVGEAFQHNIPLYLFKPPIDIMKATLRKIETSNEVVFCRMYIKACDILKIPESARVIPVHELKRLAEEFYEENKTLARREGFSE